VAIILVVIGIAIGLGFIIYLKNSMIPVREKYFEIWYPLASYKLLIPLSVSFILFGTIQLNAHYQFNFINLLGKNSLFVYLISAFFDSIIEEKQVDQFSSTNKLILLITMTLIIIIMTYLLSVVKKRDLWKKIPKFVKFILGT
jgi:fucose 4-O-acetylase-like acetyltransferase